MQDFNHDIKHRLKSFIDKPASNHLLAHISHQASLVIPCHHTNEHYKSPIPPLPTFVNLLARRSSSRTGTLLASLVLLDRLRQRLAQFARGMPCTCQRIFLATLIVTTKILHDTSPKNKHWTKYAVYFTLAEINLMEKQLLALMNYQLVITEKDMYHTFIHYDNIIGLQLPPILPNRDRYFLPKSATFTNNHGLSNMILQQPHEPIMKKSQSHYSHKKRHHHHYHNNDISTSVSSSSISSALSSNSMEDLVVTPTTSTNEMISTKLHLNDHWFDPQQQHYYYPTAHLFKH